MCKISLFIISVISFCLAGPEWDNLLSYAVCKEGVYYTKLKESDHITKTDQEFQKVTKSQFQKMNRDAQLAWYINLYNFYTIKLIVEHLPLKNGIRDIGKPWEQKFVPLFGKKVSLNHIEHGIIRKEFDEPRIHFALVCASIGCPPLRRTAFTEENLSTELQEVSVAFLKDPSKNYVQGKKLYLSKIFSWYGGDFKKKHGSYQKYIKNELGLKGKYKVKFLNYDWNLNRATCR